MFNPLNTSSPPNSENTPDPFIRSTEPAAHIKQLWFLLGSILIFFSLINVLRRLWTRFARPSTPRIHDSVRTTSTSININDEEKGAHSNDSKSLPPRLYRTLEAWKTAFRIVLFRWTIPIGSGSVAELVCILGYMAVMFSWLFVTSQDSTPTIYYDRAALIAASQIPLVIALSGKNNVISLLTGVGYEKLNVLHRASARTIFVFLWIHASGRVASGLPQGYDFSRPWIVSGVLGLTALTLGTILSIRPIRYLAFEFFLLTHIILILIFLIGTYYHAKQSKYVQAPLMALFSMGTMGAKSDCPSLSLISINCSFQNYIWPGLLLWVMDRFIRLGRLVWNNRVWGPTATTSRSSHPRSGSDALVELVSEDTVRLTVYRNISWIPGQHAYIILPGVSTLPFEAHPFTIASIPHDNGEPADLVFLIRAKGGFTRRLLELADKCHGSRIPAMIDGPYGCPPDPRDFSTCVLIAGGSGISYTLPLLLNIIKTHAEGGKSSVQRIVFIWVIRDADHLRWVSETLMSALDSATPSLAIEPRIYITRNLRTRNIPEDQVSIASSRSSGSSVDQDAISLPEYQAHSSQLSAINGRPDFKQLLDHEIEISHGHLSVDVAGPSGLADCVRRALRSNLAGPKAVLKGLNSVTLHIQAFGM